MTLSQYTRILDAAANNNWTDPLTLHLDNGETHALYPASQPFEGVIVFSTTPVADNPILPRNPPISPGVLCIPLGSICVIEFKS